MAHAATPLPTTAHRTARLPLSRSASPWPSAHADERSALAERTALPLPSRQQSCHAGSYADPRTPRACTARGARTALGRAGPRRPRWARSASLLLHVGAKAGCHPVADDGEAAGRRPESFARLSCCKSGAREEAEMRMDGRSPPKPPTGAYAPQPAKKRAQSALLWTSNTLCLVRRFAPAGCRSFARLGPPRFSNVWKFSLENFQRLEKLPQILPMIGNFASKTSNHWKIGLALLVAVQPHRPPLRAGRPPNVSRSPGGSYRFARNSFFAQSRRRQVYGGLPPVKECSRFARFLLDGSLPVAVQA